MNDEQGKAQPPRPEKPWLAEADWARGVAKDTARGYSGMEMWFFAVFANLVGLPLGLVLHEELPKYTNDFAWAAFIPPVLTLALLLRAIFITVRQGRNTTRFELDTLPGVIGGFLRGTAYIAAPLKTANVLRYQLSCNADTKEPKKLFGSGRRFTRYVRMRHQLMPDILHREDGMIPLESVSYTGRDYAVPVEVGIPYSCEETKLPAIEGRRIRWNLYITAELPKKTVEVWFHVPVYRTAESDPTYTVSTTAETSAKLGESFFDRTSNYAGIRVTRNSDGVSYDFGPGRSTAAAIFSTVLTLAFSIATAVAHYKGVRPVIVYSLGGLTALFFYGTLQACLGSTVLRVQWGELSIRKGILGIGIPKRIPLREIRDIKVKQIGEEGGVQQIVYYDLVAVLNDDKEVTLAHYIEEKAQAESLATNIKATVDCM